MNKSFSHIEDGLDHDLCARPMPCTSLGELCFSLEFNGERSEQDEDFSDSDPPSEHSIEELIQSSTILSSEENWTQSCSDCYDPKFKLNSFDNLSCKEQLLENLLIEEISTFSELAGFFNAYQKPPKTTSLNVLKSIDQVRSTDAENTNKSGALRSKVVRQSTSKQELSKSLSKKPRSCFLLPLEQSTDLSLPELQTKVRVLEQDSILLSV